MAAGTPTVTVELSTKTATVTGVTNPAGSTYRYQLTGLTPYVVGDVVTIYGIIGSPGSNGTYTVTAVGANTFDVTNAAGQTWTSTTSTASSETWVDVSSLVVGNSMSIVQGRPDSNSDPQPGTLTLSLDNFDGRFTPSNPTSIYYPYLIEGARIRVTVTRNGSSWVRFLGRLTDLQPDFSVSPAQSVVNLTAVDALGIMQRRKFVCGFESEYARGVPGSYALVRSILSTSPPQSNPPLAYYPLTEPNAASGFYDLEALQPVNYSPPFKAVYWTTGGSVNAAGDSSWVDGLPNVSVTPGGGLRGTINPNYFAAFGTFTSLGQQTLRVWVNLQSTGEVFSTSRDKRAPGATMTVRDGVIVTYDASTSTLTFTSNAGTLITPITSVAKGWHLLEFPSSITAGIDTLWLDGKLSALFSATAGSVWWSLTQAGQTCYVTLGGTITAGYRGLGLYAYPSMYWGTVDANVRRRISDELTGNTVKLYDRTGSTSQALNQLGALMSESQPSALRGLEYLNMTLTLTSTITSTTFAAGVLTVNITSGTPAIGSSVRISGSTAGNNGVFNIDSSAAGTFTVANASGVAAGAVGYVTYVGEYQTSTILGNSTTQLPTAPVPMSGRSAFDVFMDLARTESGRVFTQYTATTGTPVVVPLDMVRHDDNGTTYTITATSTGTGTLTLSALTVRASVGQYVRVTGNSVTANNGTFQVSAVTNSATGVTGSVTVMHPGGAGVGTGGTFTLLRAPLLYVDSEQDVMGAPTFIREIAAASNMATVSSTSASVSVADTAGDPRTSSSSVSMTAASASLNLLTSLASQLIALGKYQGLRPTDLTVDLATSQNDRYSDFFAMYPGSTVVLTGLPSSHLGVTQMSGVLEGWTERPSPDGYVITMNVSAATPRESSYGYGDSFGFGDGNAYLGAAITSSATSLVLTWTSGDVLSTSAADYPLDLNVNGERVTVTAAPAGSTSPQTLTVSRGVAPTVARAHNQYEPVELWTPATLAP